MTLLIDTHVALWLYAAPNKIPEATRSRLVGGEALIASAASAWEYEIKREKFGDSFGPPFTDLVELLAAEEHDFPFACHKDAYDLPPIHADPFDRMLVAHARHLGCSIVTADKVLQRYPVKALW